MDYIWLIIYIYTYIRYSIVRKCIKRKHGFFSTSTPTSSGWFILSIATRTDLTLISSHLAQLVLILSGRLDCDRMYRRKETQHLCVYVSVRSWFRFFFGFGYRETHLLKYVSECFKWKKCYGFGVFGEDIRHTCCCLAYCEIRGCRIIFISYFAFWHNHETAGCFILSVEGLKCAQSNRAGLVCRWLYICTYSCLFSINVDLVLLPLASVQSSNVFQRAQTWWTRLKLFLLPHMQPHSECIGFLSSYLYLCLLFLGAQIPVIQGCFWFFF